MQSFFISFNYLKSFVSKRVLFISLISLGLLFLFRELLIKLSDDGYDQGLPTPQLYPINEKTNVHQLLLLRHPTSVEYLHQSWKTSRLPPRFQKWASTWQPCFPNAKYILWSDDDNRNFIGNNYEWFLKRYDSLPHPVDRADAVRYIYMYHFGGIYTDLDNECLRPFNHLLRNATIVLGSMDGKKNVAEGYVQNSFMYSVPRHQFWLDVLHLILNDKRKHPVAHHAGPKIIGEAVNYYRRKHPNSRDITIYPSHYFNPFSWQTNKNKACKLFNRMSEADLKLCRQSFLQKSYVVQYHSHTWGGGKV